jgi:hypothetical protein
MDHYDDVTPDMMPELPEISDAEADAMAAEFEFEELTIEELDDEESDEESDEPDCDDGDNYYDDQHDLYGGGGMIGGDSDLMDEF